MKFCTQFFVMNKTDCMKKTSDKIVSLVFYQSRLAMKLRKEEMAEKLRCSYHTIQSIESNRRSGGYEMLSRLADFRGKDLSDMVCEAIIKGL